MSGAPRLRPLGDAVVLVELADSLDDAAFQAVRAAVVALEHAAIAAVREVVPAYTSIAVHYDPLALRYDDACAAITAALASATTAPAPEQRIVEVPVHYGGADGPDLDDVARHTGLDASAVVRLHAGAEYTVRMIGFAPGFPYLSGMPPELATPRRGTPRERVPAGAVGIAGVQTGIYPLPTPGGWNLIGRTDVSLFRPHEEPPTLLRVGDRVRFLPLA